MTGVLIPRELTKKDFTVKVKRNPGAKLSSLKNGLHTLPNTKVDAFVIHAGINNVSNADSEKLILEEFKDLTDKIQSVHSNAKIICSSILPKKHDRLSLNVIKNVNDEIKVLCDTNGFYFMDNTKTFMPT